MVNMPQATPASGDVVGRESPSQQPIVAEIGYLSSLRHSPRTGSSNGNGARLPLVSRRSHSPSGNPRRLSSTESSPSLLSPDRVTARAPEALINELEAEHEYITNGLLRKVDQLRTEKIQLENAMEAEQEMLVNRLQRQISLRRSGSDQEEHGLSTPPLPALPAPGSPSRFGERPLFHSRASSASSVADLRLPGSVTSPVAVNAESSQVELFHAFEQVRTENQALKAQLASAHARITTLSQMASEWRNEALQQRAKTGTPDLQSSAGVSSHGNLGRLDRSLSSSSELSPPLHSQGFLLGASPPEGETLRRSSDARGDLNELRELRESRRRPSQA